MFIIIINESFNFIHSLARVIHNDIFVITKYLFKRVIDTRSTDDGGYAALNPLYMKYTPRGSGHFDGQAGYGYRSIELFVEAAEAVNAGNIKSIIKSNLLK
jgi:hypothetical protein